MKMIEELYGEHYHQHVLLVDVDDVGHSGAARERVYVILTHKELTEQILDPLELYAEIAAEIKRHVSTRPRDYFISSPEEVIFCAQELARVRKKPFKAKLPVSCLFFGNIIEFVEFVKLV